MNALNATIATALLSMLFACTDKPQEQEQNSLMEASKQELTTALEERDQLLALVRDISLGMRQIKQLENIMTIAATHPNENADQRTQILSDIARIRQVVQKRREQLLALDAKLQKSALYNDELKETIQVLREQIDGQASEIESLRRQLYDATEQIDDLNDQMDSLTTTVLTVAGERDAALESSLQFENELNTCYYIAADKNQLKQHNIIESGFLRKTKLMKGDFDKNVFVAGDKRTLRQITLDTQKIKILTNHPETSYEIINSDGKKVLKITNPQQFWSLTNYLVIQED